MATKNNSFGNRKSAKPEGGIWITNEKMEELNEMTKAGMAFELLSMCHIVPPQTVFADKFKGKQDNFEDIFVFVNATLLKTSVKEFSDFYTACAIRGKLYYIHTEASKNGEVPAIINPLWKGLLENCLHQLPENQIKEIASEKFAKIRIELEREVIQGKIEPVEKEVLKYFSEKMNAKM